MPHPSKYAVLFVLLISVFVNSPTQAQSPQVSYQLETDQSDATKTYVARDQIVMKPGFVYSATLGTSFNARIDEHLVCPATYQTVSELVDPYEIINTSLPVGTIEGTVQITPSGAATYQIPIQIPAGVNGVQPYLSVTYNSQAGNGLLGYRCDLSAFSAITRTGKTYYHDGDATAPNLTTSDNLLLDGQRLMRTSGSNLITGSKYATEIESYSEIIYKTINSLPAFEVKTKEGRVLEYGATTNSNIEAQGTNTTLMWLLNKTTDKNGNYILYNYEKNSDTKEFRLESIEYTGNLNQSPTCKVEFFYETRSDTIDSYVTGKKQQSTVILHKVRTSVLDNKIKEYKFNYFYDGYYTKLTEITEFGNDNTHFNSTKIDWGDFYGESSRYANEELAFLSTSRQGYFPVFADFTGDGKTDFLSFPTKAYYNQFDSMSLYVSNSIWGNINFNKKNSITYWQHLVADLDGNGTMDLITKHPTGNSGYWVYDFYSYDGNHLVSNGRGFEALGQETLTGDFNGDGKDEILIKNTQDVYNEIGIKIASGGIDNWGTSSIVRFLSSIHLIDFNGNGKTNILVMNGTSAWVYELNGSSFQKLTTFSTSEISTSFAVFPGDYNGDGKTDILAQDLSQNLSNLDNIFILFSTGTNFLKKEIAIPGFPEVQDELFVGDFNKDGKSDVLFFNKVSQENDTILNPVVGLFNGNNFVVNEHNTSYILASKFRRHNGERNFSISDFDGDGRDEFCLAAYSDACVISFFTDDQNLLVRNIIDGFGNTTSFDYSTICEDATYTETGTTPVYPVVSSRIPLTVVKSLNQSIGGTFNSQYYNYKNLRLHKRGKGFLCFGEITATDFSKSQKSVAQYNYNTTYFNSFITEQKVYTTSDVLLSTTIFNNSFLLTGTKRIFPYVSSQTQTDHLTTNTQTTTYSNWEFGNPKNISKTFSGSISESTSIVYQNTINSNVRITGLPTVVQVNKVSNGQILEEKSITEYNPQFLPSKVTTYITPASKRTGSRSFSYDVFGNVLTDSVRLYSSSNALVTTYEFSSDRRLPIRKTNPIGLYIDYQYDTSGRLISVKDHKNNITRFELDAFGRQVKQSNPDGTEMNNAFSWESEPYNSTYSITHSITEKPTVKTLYDAAGREIRSIQTCFDGSYLKIDTKYDSKGRLWKTSLPYKTTNPTLWNEYHYDVYHRVDTLKYPSGRKDWWQYANNTITSNINGISFGRVYNSIGQLISAGDPGGIISYNLRPDGQPATITTFGSIVTSFGYDSYGRQTSINDPSAGLLTYHYDYAGNIDTITNANGIKTIMQYDNYNKLSNKAFTEFSTSYLYNADGLLTNETSTNGTSKEYTYDNHGRMLTAKETVPDSKWLQKTYSYNQGNIQYIVYSANTGSIASENYYYSNGHLSEIKLNAQNSIWRLEGENNWGLPTAATTGSISRGYGYTTYGLPTYRTAEKQGNYFLDQSYFFEPQKGNLESREDYVYGRYEYFQYDNLNRIVNIQGDNFSYTVDYNNKGNITNLSNVGTFQYNNTNKPYAITDVIPNGNTVPLWEQYVSYTSFMRTDTISENGYQAVFAYNSQADRVRMEVKDLGSQNTQLTRYYIGDNYETDIIPGGSIQRLYLGGDAYTAPAVYIKDGSSSWNIYYICRDYLGSITHITNSSGTVAQELSYDVWGRLRNPVTQDIYELNSIPNLLLGRGFTGHEYLPWFGLINMNARLYDPVVGQFLSPDPYVAALDFTQDYNRYTYARNNPLMYVDPSGEFIQWIIAGAIILGKTYYDGYKANNKEINPTKWNWNNASYSIGIGGSSDGISSYYINVGIGWDTGFTPVIGFSQYGFGFGYHNFAGNFFVGYPGHNYDKAAEDAYEAISRTDWGIDYLQRRRDYMRSGSLSNIHPEFDILLLGQWSATNRVIGQVENAANGASTIVGEGMKRVSMEAAKHPSSVILNNMPKFTGAPHQVTSQMMTYNRQWILQQMRSGRPIIDIGLDPTRGVPSIFYQMEQNMMKNYLKLHPGAFY